MTITAHAVWMRIRLFPAVIMVAVLALGVRVSDIYDGLGTLGAPDAASAAEEQDAAEESADSEQDKPAAEGDTAEGGQAGEAGAEAGGALERPFVLSLPSDEERELLTQLRGRRELLDRRERQLELQEQTLQGVEKRIDDKIAALQVLEGQIREHLRIFDEQEAQQLEAIVQVYQTMKPKDAAPRFEQLELEIQVDLATRMAGRKFADILSKMSTPAATRLTTELATRAQPPSLEDVQGGS